MIELVDIKKKYDDFELKASMTIDEGQTVGIAGSKGSGKSTFVKAILGLTRCDSGAIKVDAGKEELGTVLADSFFNGNLLVTDLAKMLNKFYSEFDEEYFNRECKKLKIPENKSIGTMSEGARAKLKAITALSHNARLIIMDEPFAGLEDENKEVIRNLILQYKEKKKNVTFLVTSERVQDIDKLCDKVYVLKDGSFEC